MSDYFPNDITSADATLIMTVEDLYPSGIRLQGFSADSSAVLDSIQIVEARMGVDGQMAAGYTPAIHTLTISLEASSPSYAVMVAVYQAMITKKHPYSITIVINIPSISRTCTYSNGVMTGGTAMTGLKKVLDPTTWNFSFEKFETAKV